MNRREFTQLGGAALLTGGWSLSFAGKIAIPPGRSKRIFFEETDIPRIQANGRSVLLGKKFREWAERSPESLKPAWEQFYKSGNIVSDLRKVWAAFEETAVVQLIEPTEAGHQALIDSIEAAIQLPKWEYMMDGDEVLGLMRSSMATSRLLFGREVLGDQMDPELDERLMKAIAEKGVAPCYRTIYGMEHPDKVVGWRFDPEHPHIQDTDMSRWPEILGSNNLRGAPTMALGIGALALLGRDDRAEMWLAAAEESARTAFQLFFRDGSYFEGLSYSEYLLRTVLAFCEAHYRIKGTIDWTQELDFDKHLDYIAAMQAGKKSDGNPDIVNFSDASKSIYPCVSAWIEKHTGNPVAQYATDHFAEPGYFLDYLWYRPNRPSRAPSQTIKNYRNEQDWVICRSGWRPQDAVLAFRSGRPANHEHADRNSFLYKIYGERLLNDPFGSAYNPTSPAWTLRLTRAHNSILIGGKGHQYHNGEEGVNESQATARLIRWNDLGNTVTWCSDATQAYQLVDSQVTSVTRTILFAKPNVIAVLDRVFLNKEARTLEARFFPDNRDDAAKVSANGRDFKIHRPQATLFGQFASSAQAKAREQLLDLVPGVIDPDKPAETSDSGTFPFIGITANAAPEHSLLTVLVARPDGFTDEPAITIRETDSGWEFEADGVRGAFDTRNRIPKALV